MECQLCKGTITPVSTSNIEILSCQSCRGFWIKKGALNKLIKHKAGDVEFSSIDHHMHQDTHGILKCAFCPDTAMIKVNFIDKSDIVLDYCEECGAFWVDSGEVEKMQQYMDTIEKQNRKITITEIIMQALYSLPK